MQETGHPVTRNHFPPPEQHNVVSSPSKLSRAAHSQAASFTHSLARFHGIPQPAAPPPSSSPRKTTGTKWPATKEAAGPRKRTKKTSAPSSSVSAVPGAGSTAWQAPEDPDALLERLYGSQTKSSRREALATADHAWFFVQPLNDDKSLCEQWDGVFFRSKRHSHRSYTIMLSLLRPMHTHLVLQTFSSRKR